MTNARIGIADTTFARVDMAQTVTETIEAYANDSDVEVTIEHTTVPGFKDLPVAAKKLIEEQGCEIVLALGQAGPEPIDKQCAHEASLGLQHAQLATNTHILETFIHTDETPPGADGELRWLAENRAREHALNALWMLFEPDRMNQLAGTGQREGYHDEGPIEQPPQPPKEEPA